MRRLLQFAAVCVVVALLLLWGLSQREKQTARAGAETPYTDILDEIKDAGKQAGDSLNEFLDESGIKESAADILEKGAELIRESNKEQNQEQQQQKEHFETTGSF